MKCKNKDCGSNNLKTRPNGPHIELYCGDCGAYQKFISKEDAEKLKDNKDGGGYL